MSHGQPPTSPPDAAAPPAPPPARLFGLLAQYDNVDALLAACERVRDAGYTRWDTYSPIPIHGLDEAMGIRGTRLPLFVFLCGLIGAVGGLAMQWWMNSLDYPYIVSGKPLVSLPAFIPVTFETTVLLAALGAFVGMLAFNKLPRLYHGFFRSNAFAGRVTIDRYFIGIEADDRLFDETATRQLLEQTGPLTLEAIEEPLDQPLLPAWVRGKVVPVMLVLAALSILPLLWITLARNSYADRTRVQVIPDMDAQAKYRPQSANALFADHRSMRPLVPGTVARGHADLDEHLYRGIVEGQWAEAFPMEVTIEMVRRGRQRFDIFCSPCHGLDGMGRGTVAARAEIIAQGTWVPPTSLLDATVLARPVGHLFNTITHGIRTMPAYGDQIPVPDRWAIVSYVRALQRSQNATLDDVPPQFRRELQSRE